MSIAVFNAGSIFHNQQSGIGTMFAGNGQKTMLKSTEEKQKRQQEAASQIEFWEEQKAALKDVRCETLEEIAEKLRKLSGFDQQIANVKSQYNNEQMCHALDEAIERGEQLHEKIEESQKTPEEKRKELLEEALGIKDEDESDGLLEELLEEVEEITDVLSDGLLEEVLEENQPVLEASNQKNLLEQANETKRPAAADTSVLQKQEALEAITGHASSSMSSGIQSYEATMIENPQETYAHFNSIQ